MKRVQPTCFAVTSEMLEQLDQVAAARGLRSRSSVAREAITEWLRYQPEIRQPEVPTAT